MPSSMSALHRKLASATIPADKECYQRQIEATDWQIDALVYELYGLTGEEIADVRNTNGMNERERHERQASRPSRPFESFVVQIDALVYDLYGLTEEEIAVVEGRLDHE